MNFLKKEVLLEYSTQDISLREVIELLAKIAYEPDLKLNHLEKEIKSTQEKSLVIKLGVAGFCFGNVMMNSFPEYFGSITNLLVKDTFSYYEAKRAGARSVLSNIYKHI